MRFLLFIAPLILLILPSPLNSTPSHAHDGSLSKSQLIREELFVPARHANTTIESHLDPAPLGLVKALPVVSGDGSNENSAKSTIEEENLSLDELEKQSDQANITISTWRNLVETYRGDLDKKMEEAKGPNQEYANKKEQWERLKNISDTIGAEWNEKRAKAKRTVKDFEALEESLLNANETHQTNVEMLASKEEEAKNAQIKLDELKGIPDKIQSLNDQIAAMDDNAKQALQDSVNTLDDIVTAKKTAWDQTISLQRTFEGEVAKASCDKGGAERICATASHVRIIKGKAVADAKTAYDDAQTDLRDAKELLKSFGTRKKALQNQLRNLRIPSTSAITVAEENVNITNKLVDECKQEVNESSTIIANLTLELTQKRPEYEQSKLTAASLPPDDVTTASYNVDVAWMALEGANETVATFDAAVQKIKTQLQDALNTLEEATLKAEALTKRYEAAKRKAEPQNSGVSPATMSGIAAGVIVPILILIALALVCYKRKKGVYPWKKGRSCKNNAVSTKSTTNASATPSTNEQRAGSALAREQSSRQIENAAACADPPAVPVPDPAKPAAEPSSKQASEKPAAKAVLKPGSGSATKESPLLGDDPALVLPDEQEPVEEEGEAPPPPDPNAPPTCFKI